MSESNRQRLWRPQVYSALVALPLVVAGALLWTSPDRTRTDDTPAVSEPAAEQSGGDQAFETKPEVEHKFTNALVHETSPYLLQHAHNPVNWLPWGEKAFALAREQNKPIFLSVGYSTCYWCHVMERESFEDEEVAAVLNEHFVCVKVDREERPDVDEQYMIATQLTGRGGGWPNSVWLMPDGRPWMAGTYFPKDTFMQGLKELARLWKEEHESVVQRAELFERGIKQTAGGERGLAAQSLDRELATRLRVHIGEEFDEVHAGFGSRPKFPPHGNLEFLLHELSNEVDEEQLRLVTRTLDAIWQGGIHDHIGGGFHRYAVDERWLVPHFEKMLYDNAQLMRSYAEAYALTKEPRYREAVADIFAWLQREMTHPQGGFYSALDSESEGHEGKFYVWTTAELKELLGEEETNLFAAAYNFEPEGNFTEERSGEKTGENIPHLTKSLEELAEQRRLTTKEVEDQLSSSRARLLAARNKRVYPHRDDKILASWNGLMISALAQAGHQLEEPRYTQSAAKAADFVLTQMMRDGSLLRSWRDGKGQLPGYLDDYAYLAEGLMDLHDATGEAKWLTDTRTLTDMMLAEFEDPAGGFFFTSEKHDTLLIRSKNVLGGGNLPTANGVAAQVLLRLAKATGEARYSASARKCLESLSGLMNRAPQATESLIVATSMLLEQPGENAAASQKPHYEAFPVTVELAADKAKVRPGESIQLEVKLTVAKGWHLYGENKDAKFVVPTTLTVEEQDWLAKSEVDSPEGKLIDDAVAKQPLSVLEEEAAFQVRMEIAADARLGKQTLRTPLRFQACDQSRCLEPQKIVLEFRLEIVK